MMKRLILPLLLAMLLCGCTGKTAGTTGNTSPLPSVPIQSLYDPNSTIEELTEGAVQAYSLAGHQPTGLLFFGERLLVFTTDEHISLTTLLALQGEQPGIAQSVTLDCALEPNQVTISADGSTLAYYNPQENCMVYLDKTLAETRRVQLPDQVTDRPVLTDDLQTLFYAAGSQIYALDMSNGLPRMIKQHSCIEQSLRGLHFGGTVLEVFLTQEDGKSQVAFISTDSGETIGFDADLLTISSTENKYLLQRLDGTVTEVLTGTNGGGVQALQCQSGEAVWPAFSLNGLVGINGSQVCLYDLESGKIRAKTDLGKLVQVTEIVSDPNARTLWLRVTDHQTDTPLLLRWDVTASGISQSESYLSKRYTAADPDSQGIAAVQEKANAVGKDLGLTIVVNGAVPTPQGYSFVTEHQVRALDEGLAQLQLALEPLPAEFLAPLGSVNQSGTVHIALVRDIQDITGISKSDMGGLHYVSAGNHYILLTVGGDMNTALLHQLCHVLDAYVYAHSSDYDLWDNLNPWGFKYTGSYDVTADPDDANLQGDSQRFVSAYGMSFAREDRATLFTAAMTPGNDALFAISGIQNKLRYMCDAIREAYGWEKTDITLPWEQYLQPK